MSGKRGEISDFEAFVKRHQPGAGAVKSDDWAQEQLGEWRDLLNRLYSDVESFLDDYIKNGEISICYSDVHLNEEDIGAYSVRKMTLRIGSSEVTLTPIGTLLIGTKGRVDIDGAAGRTRLLLVDKDATKPRISIAVGRSGFPPPQAATRKIEWTWKIATRPPHIQYTTLTREALFEALMEVTNG